jgi:predicted aspartyl protease
MARVWLGFDPKRTPIVRVRIGPRRYEALVDTGAQVTMISPDESLRLGLRQIGHQEIVGLMGQRELLRLVQLPKIGFGNIELDPCRAGIFEVAKLGLPIDLILGVNAFRGRRLQFDFIDGRIYIIE